MSKTQTKTERPERKSVADLTAEFDALKAKQAEEKKAFLDEQKKAAEELKKRIERAHDIADKKLGRRIREIGLSSEELDGFIGELERAVASRAATKKEADKPVSQPVAKASAASAQPAAKPAQPAPATPAAKPATPVAQPRPSAFGTALH